MVAPSPSEFAKAPEVIEAGEIVANISTLTKDYRITTPEAYAQGAEQLKLVKGAQKKIEALQDAITRPMNAALKAARDLFRPRLEAIAAAETTIKRELVRFQDEQDRQRREEQRKADERAEAERQRLARLEQKAIERGDEQKAATFQERAATVVAPVIQREAPKVSGIATREAWKFQVEDPALIPREYLMVDEAKIRKVVVALKGDTKIAGVRVYAEKVLAAGAA
jgi:hypothetical protein